MANANSPYKTREALLESIATAAALAQTANTEREYMHWDNRRAELGKLAGSLTPQEEAAVVEIAIKKADTYNAETPTR